MEFVADPRGKAPHEAEARARLLKLGHNVSSWGPLRLERSILLMGTWRDLGTREEMHMVRYLAHLVPSLEADPWFQERVWSFFDTRRGGRQVTNWWGCQNSGKTKTMAIMAIGFGVLHPRRTRQLVSGPFKEAGDSEIWGQMCETYDEVRREWATELERMGCGMKKMESRAVLRFSDEPRAGTLKLIAMDEVGKVQGGKARDRQQQSGYVLMWLDEIGARYQWRQLANDEPPIDEFRGRPILSKDEWNAGYASRVWGLARHTLNELGIRGLGPSDTFKNDRLPAWMQTAKSIPVVGSALKAFVATDNYGGIREEQRARQTDERIDARARQMRGEQTKAAMRRLQYLQDKGDRRNTSERHQYEMLRRWYSRFYHGTEKRPGLMSVLKQAAAGDTRVDAKYAREKLDQTAEKALKAAVRIGHSDAVSGR